MEDESSSSLKKSRKQFNTAFESELTSVSLGCGPSSQDADEVTSVLRDGSQMSCMQRKLQQALFLGRVTREYLETTSPKPRKRKKSESDVDSDWQVLDALRAEQKVKDFNREKRKLRKKLKTVALRDSFPQPAWVPPHSPYGLVQEQLFRDPWKVVMACIFLHKTSGTQMKKVLETFFERFPGPQHVLDAAEGDITAVIQSLGLYNRRVQLIKKFCHEYLYTDWADITQLFGVGPYAADAYRIFVEGKWRQVIPDDSKLDLYWNWLHTTQMKGCDESSPVLTPCCSTAKPRQH